WLHNDLELVIVLQAVWILAIAAVLRSPARLDIGRPPGSRTQRAQCRRRVERARTHLVIIRLQDQAALGRPEVLQSQDEVLKGALFFRRAGHDSHVLKASRNL